MNDKIEKGVRGLVKELNSVGLETRYSCEGHNGSNAWISLTGKNIKEITIIPNNGIIITWKREVSNERLAKERIELEDKRHRTWRKCRNYNTKKCFHGEFVIEPYVCYRCKNWMLSKKKESEKC